MKPDTAIPLAAGVSCRMGLPDTPKSLLPLGGTDGHSATSFLARQLNLLRGSGVENLVVIVDHRRADRFEHLKALGATVVANPHDTGAMGSTLSLLAGLRHLAASEAQPDGLLVLDCDIVFERRLIDWIVGACSASRLFTTAAASGDNEEVRVYAREDATPVLIGKGISPVVSQGLRVMGESLGIIHVGGADLPLLTHFASWLTGWPPELPAYGFSRERSEHEEIWQYLFTLGRMTASFVPNGLLFAECDTLDDYSAISNRIFSQILARDAATEQAVKTKQGAAVP